MRFHQKRLTKEINLKIDSPALMPLFKNKKTHYKSTQLWPNLNFSILYLGTKDAQLGTNQD